MGDGVNAFFDFSVSLQRVHISEGQAQGNVIVPEDKIFVSPNELIHIEKGTNYAKQYKRIEEKRHIQRAGAGGSIPALTTNPQSFVVDRDRMSAVDDLTSVCTGVPNLEENEALAEVYDKYNFTTTKASKALPIVAYRAKIVAMIAANQTTIIRGKTGCGKSTQVPQYILNYHVERKLPCNIIVTQPRRIAAVTVAKRVCSERNWEMGSIVGYQVGLDTKNVCEDTRLTFCTTGVLLQKLINDKTMGRYTHVIIDEVHERSQDMDFVLILIKKMLRDTSPGVKVVLMSATFNVELFSEYFITYMVLAGKNGIKHISAPIIDLDKEKSPQKGYRVDTFYLDTLAMLPGKVPVIRGDEPGITSETYKLVVNLIKEFDEMDTEVHSRGAVLVFLPGINEIEELFNLLLDAMPTASRKSWWIKPLHSTLTTDEQTEVFLPPPEGQRKIILSTNIAESSITVADIAYVIDFCLTKHLICDTQTNFSSLQLAWASKANCIQRAGRTGRVCHGRVFRLVLERFYETLADEDTSEMLRGPLERVVLLTKLLDMGSPKAFLALAIDPPNLGAIEKAILLLKERGGLLPTLNGEFTHTDGDITFLGRVMAKLPVDPVVSKLILLGHVFSMMSDCIVMGAAMTMKSMFSSPFQQRLEAYHNRLSWADSSCSDCISFLNAYQVWRHLKNTDYFRRSVGDGENAWGARNFIQMRAMNEVHLLVLDITKRLLSLGIEVTVGAGRVVWTPLEKPLGLKIVLAGAFYPNFFVRGEQGGPANEQVALRALDGHDPFTSVYLSGLPTNQPNMLYAESVKKPLRNCANTMMVSFDNSTKAYVQFASTTFPGIKTVNHRILNANIPGKIVMGVYRAVKLRQLNIPIIIPMLTPEESEKRAIALGLSLKSSLSLKFQGLSMIPQQSTTVKPWLPSFDTSSMPLLITYTVDVGHFWAQNLDMSTVASQKWIFDNLNNPDFLVPPAKRPSVGRICAAPFVEDGVRRHFRAKVEAVRPRKNGTIVEVLFVDYGNVEQVLESDLRDFGPELLERGIMTTPPQAFECVLAKVQPSVVENQNGLWTERAKVAFADLTNNAKLYGNVYSVVFGVVHLELLVTKKVPGRQPLVVDVNRWLVSEGFAQVAEESYSSQLNHEHRVSSSLRSDEVAHLEQLQDSNWIATDVPSPDPSECTVHVKLRGPSSPLEMKLYATTRVGAGREVIIEQSSVNSVLLDTDPQDTHERLLVAACVGQNASGGRISLRHTTLMPNIHGLPALLALLFAPEAQLRSNKSRSRYIGALCGLGLNHETGRGVFADHDMEVTFDMEFSTADIQEINKMRFWLNECFVNRADTLSEDCSPIVHAQNKIKTILFRLLKQHRKSVEVEYARVPFRWDADIDPKLLIKPCDTAMIENNCRQAVYRFHWGLHLRLADNERAETIELLMQVDQLRNAIDSGTQLRGWTTCNICNYSVTQMSALASHLSSNDHEAKEEALRFRLQQDAEQVASA